MTDRARALALLAVCVGFAAYNSWEGFGWEVTSDELGWLHPGSVADMYFDAESAINPPLLRILVNVPFSTAVAPTVGRIASFVSFLGAVALMFWIGCYVGKSLLSGVAAALLLACNGLALEQAVMFRSYSFWLLVGTWHVYAFVRLIREDRNASHGLRAQVAASAVLLPWIHYSSVLFLLCEGAALLAVDRRRWRDIALFVPAAVAFTPALWLMLSPAAKAWMPPSHTPSHNLGQFAAISANFARPQVVALLVALAVLWRRCPDALRVLVLAWGGMLLSLVLLGTRHDIRPVGALWLSPMLFAMFAGLPSLARRFGPRLLLWSVVVGYLVGALIVPSTAQRQSSGMSRALEKWPQWHEVADGRPAYVRPYYSILVLHYVIYEQLYRERPQPRRCIGHPLCLVHDGVVVIGQQNQKPIDGVLFEFDCGALEEPQVGCVVLERAPCLRVSDCKAAP